MGKQALFYYPYEFSSASSTFQELGTCYVCYVFLMKLDYIQLPTTYVVTVTNYNNVM